MQILLIGGFDIARTLAASLLKRKYQVAAVHPDYGCCKQLADIKGLQVIHGDGAKPFILEEAGARRTDIAIALTDSEASPLAAGADHLLIARSDMASFVDSYVAPLSVINALIVAISKKKQEEVSETFAKLEAIWEEYDVYANNNGKS